MPRNGRYSQRLDIGLDTDLAGKLRAEAGRRGLSVANFTRDLLAQGLAESAAAEGREVLAQAIRQAIRPSEDRLAKLIVKAAVAAATAMYLNTQALADLGKHDAVELYQAARKKAVAYLSTPEERDGKYE